MTIKIKKAFIYKLIELSGISGSIDSIGWLHHGHRNHDRLASDFSSNQQ